MFARLVSKIIVGVFFFCSAYAEGSLQERLNAFQTLSADIVETTVSDGIVREMKGTLAIKRPNHFAWRMTAPDAQEIISNGKKIWQYEPDLDQVIVREIDQELQGVPLLLLSGDVTER
jgi:outer membrane lipoprotein carrier protein